MTMKENYVSDSFQPLNSINPDFIVPDFFYNIFTNKDTFDQPIIIPPCHIHDLKSVFEYYNVLISKSDNIIRGGFKDFIQQHRIIDFETKKLLNAKQKSNLLKNKISEFFSCIINTLRSQLKTFAKDTPIFDPKIQYEFLVSYLKKIIGKLESILSSVLRLEKSELTKLIRIHFITRPVPNNLDSNNNIISKETKVKKKISLLDARKSKTYLTKGIDCYFLNIITNVQNQLNAIININFEIDTNSNHHTDEEKDIIIDIAKRNNLNEIHKQPLSSVVASSLATDYYAALDILDKKPTSSVLSFICKTFKLTTKDNQLITAKGKFEILIPKIKDAILRKFTVNNDIPIEIVPHLRPPPEPPPKPQQIFINDFKIDSVTDFIYLGNNMNHKCKYNLLITRRIAIANRSFRKLKRVWKDNIDLKHKISIFKTSIITILLYGCNTWSLPHYLEAKLQRFINNCLRAICGISYYKNNMINNIKLRKKTKFPPIQIILWRRRLLWFGHLLRLPDHRIAKRML